MAGVATPEEASKGRWNDDERRHRKGADLVFPDQNSALNRSGELWEKGGSRSVNEIRENSHRVAAAEHSTNI